MVLSGKKFGALVEERGVVVKAGKGSMKPVDRWKWKDP